MMDRLIAPLADSWGSSSIFLTAQEAPGGGGFMQFAMLMAVMFGIMYFIWIRPQEKEAKKHRDLLAALKKGDKVITSGGLHGRVHALGDETVEIMLSDKVRVVINRANITTKVTPATKSSEDKKK